MEIQAVFGPDRTIDFAVWLSKHTISMAPDTTLRCSNVPYLFDRDEQQLEIRVFSNPCMAKIVEALGGDASTFPDPLQPYIDDYYGAIVIGLGPFMDSVQLAPIDVPFESIPSGGVPGLPDVQLPSLRGRNVPVDPAFL